MAEGQKPLHLGVSIDGAGRHPAAWRLLAAALEEPAGHDGASVRAALLRADTYVERARTAEAGCLDFVMLDDALACRTDGAPELGDSLDALLTMARVAPCTTAVGLVASVNVTHTEPFNVAKNVATLDWVSNGRAGWRPLLGSDEAEYAHFGRREPAPVDSLYSEAADVVDVVARLSDSWEDDAIIRDQHSGRYIDRDKVHYVDFEGEFFSVRGPSITPRSPQAQSLVVVDADTRAGDAFASRWADIIVVDAASPELARERRGALLAAVAGARRDPSEVFVMVRVEVLLGASAIEAAADLAALDAVEPWTRRDDRFRFVGTAKGLGGTLAAWAHAGATDGFVVLPARLPDDLDRFVAGTVPALAEAGVFRVAYEGTQLRHHFGLPRPANRYAADAHAHAHA